MQVTPRIFRTTLLALILVAAVVLPGAARAEMIDYPVVKLRSLDKISARTMTFEARVGSTVKFGPIYIKVQACRKAPPIEQPESASFLQIWEVTPQEEARWVFSGWMFASSPALSSMDHPVYDVWVLDCLEHKTGEEPQEVEPTPEPEAEDAEAEAEAEASPEPADTMPESSLEPIETDTAPAEDIQ